LSRRTDELAQLIAAKPDLHVHEDAALNAEPPVEQLDSPLTPAASFFIRNNGVLPAPAEPESWTLTIDGEVERPAVWTLAGLRQRFETVTVPAVLECAGNGRGQFSPATDGLQWGLGAVGCARWTGVRLADVLEHSAPKPSAVYTGHHSPDRSTANPDKDAISRGLPLDKALSPETLIAFGMNDGPLPHLHGGPLRIVAPGYPGSAWQKWLCRISLRAKEHDGEKMRGTDYRLPVRPVAPGEPLDPADFAIIIDMPVKSLITRPLAGFAVRAEERLSVAGFAWSGATPVESVAVSSDEGRSWREAELGDGEGPFAWRRFSAEIAVSQPGPLVIMARATDRAGRTQPLELPWNPRGYCNNVVQSVEGQVSS
jgi:DMSO/TMAO reductase YedYZ molybdopterin-dependent catalytic subunit